MLRQKKTTANLCLWSALCLLAACAAAPEMDQLEAAAFAHEHGWRPTALADGAAILWQAEVGKGHSTVVVSDGRLFTMGNRRRDDGYEDVVVCLDAATGQPVWQFRYPCDDIYFPGPRATPTLDDGRLYTLSWQGHLHCLDALDGSLIWSRHIADEELGKVGHWGLVGAPLVDGNRLIVTAGRAGAAFDKQTGEILWQSDPEETGLPTPLMMNAGGRRLAGIAHGAELHGVDVVDGTVIWSLPWDDSACLPPALLDDRLLLPGTAVTRLFAVADDVPQLIWERPVGFSEFQSFAVFDGHVYGFSRQNLQCVDLASGERVWRHRIGHNGALIEAGGMLVVVTGDGELVIAPASPEGFVELGRARAIVTKDNRGVPQPQQHHCWTRPVLANGHIFVRCNQGNLVAVDMTG